MAVPVEDLLFLLCTYALILEQKIQERRLRKEKYQIMINEGENLPRPLVLPEMHQRPA